MGLTLFTRVRVAALACIAATVCIAATASADGRLSPQGGTITSVTGQTGGGLQGGATGGPAVLSLLRTCATGEILKWSGSAWACSTSGGTGTVTSVATGNGLTGGTITSAGTLSVNNGTGLIFSTGALTYDNAIIQSRVSGTCTTPNSILSISTTGTVTCTTATATTTDVNNAVNGATNKVGVFSSAHVIGSGWASDDGTSWGVSGKFLITEASGNTAVTGTLTADAGNRVIDAVVSSARLVQAANTVDLATVGAGAGSCTNCSVTFDAYGRETTYSSGTAPATGTGTANTTTKWTGTSTIGNAWALDDATTWGVSSKFTITEASGNFRTFGTGTIDGAALLSSTLHTVGAVTFDGNTTLGDTSADTITFTAVAATTLDMNSHKVLNLTNGSSAQDAAAFGQIATTVNAAVSGTTNTMAKFSGTNAVGNSLWTDDGTTTKYNTTKFTLASANGNATFAGTLDVTGAATADSGARIITAAGTGLSKSTNTLSVNIAGASCSAGQHVSAISATGTGTCSADTDPGISGLTPNKLTYAATSSTLATSNVGVSGNQITFGGTTNNTIFEEGANENVFFRAGKAAGFVTIGDVATGGINIGSTTNATHMTGQVDITPPSGSTGLRLNNGAGGNVYDLVPGNSGVDNTSFVIVDHTNADAKRLIINNSGGVTIPGATVFSSTALVTSTFETDGKVFFNGGTNAIITDTATNGTSTTNINNTGYIDGSTQFRNVQFKNGKGGNVLLVDGANARATAGAGTDSPATTGTALYATNAGTTAAAVRDSTNDVEAYLAVSSSGGFVGTSTNHLLALQTNSTTAIQIDTSQNSWIKGSANHIGAGGDSPTTANAVAWFTNAGATSVVVRDSTNDSEWFVTTSNLSTVMGTQTNHGLNIQTNATNAITISTGQNVAVSGHISDANGVPSVAAGAGCGTSPTINSNSNDNGGLVTVGTSISACTVTFAHAYTNTPACTVTNNDATTATAATLGITSITNAAFIVKATGTLSGAKFTYVCIGLGS